MSDRDPYHQAGLRHAGRHRTAASRPARRRRGVASLAAAAVSVAALTAALTGSQASAIIGGSADMSVYPYVGMLLRPGQSTPSCTAVLVKTDNGVTVAVTAAHCLYNGRRTGTGARVAFGSSWSPQLPQYTGPYYINPSYDPSRSLAHDVAVIVLTARPSIAPAHLAALGTVMKARYPTVTAVGFGAPNSGHRRVATEVTVSVGPAWLYLRPGNGNTCDGDSGGPDLAPGTSTVLALTDQGSCSWDQDLRMDTSEVHSFLSAATTWRATPPVVTAALTAYSVQVGQRVTLYGHVNPAWVGETLYWQGYNGQWHTWGTTPVDRDGNYRFSIVPTLHGNTYGYHVGIKGTLTHPVGYSRLVRLYSH